MSQHTPGPWTIEDRGVFVIGASGAGDIAHVLTPLDGSDRKVNARLIAKAPDAVNLLIRLLPYVEDLDADPAYKHGTGRRLANEIRALLAEIEGGG